MSGDLTKESSLFRFLDNYYIHFTYVYGQNPIGKNHSLEITDGETIRKWTSNEVMDCFASLQLFGWWYRKDEHTIFLYFDSKANLGKVKNWMVAKYPNVRVWEVKEMKRKSCADLRRS